MNKIPTHLFSLPVVLSKPQTLKLKKKLKISWNRKKPQTPLSLSRPLLSASSELRLSSPASLKLVGAASTPSLAWRCDCGRSPVRDFSLSSFVSSLLFVAAPVPPFLSCYGVVVPVRRCSWVCFCSSVDDGCRALFIVVGESSLCRGLPCFKSRDNDYLFLFPWNSGFKFCLSPSCCYCCCCFVVIVVVLNC